MIMQYYGYTGNLNRFDLENVYEWSLGSDVAGDNVIYLNLSVTDNRIGVHPPVKNIINQKEVLDFLNKNFKHCKKL